MTKEQLLAELNSNTHVMIKPSAIEGIGVFAIQDIPKGCREIFSREDTNKEEYITINKARVDKLPSHSRHLIETYCMFDADNYFVPEDGFKKMDLVSFLNHSDKPNVISINEGEFFEAIKDIEKGEELVVDYGEIVDEE